MRTWQIVLVAGLGVVMLGLVGWTIYSSKDIGKKTEENKVAIGDLEKKVDGVVSTVNGMPKAIVNSLRESGFGQPQPIDPKSINVQVDAHAIAMTVVSVMKKDAHFAPALSQPQQMMRPGPGIDLCSADDQVCLSLMVKECTYPKVGRTRVVRKNGRRFYYVDCVVPAAKRSPPHAQPPAVAQRGVPAKMYSSHELHMHGGFPKGKDGANGPAPQTRRTSPPDSSDYVAIPVE